MPKRKAKESGKREIKKNQNVIGINKSKWKYSKYEVKLVRRDGGEKWEGKNETKKEAVGGKVRECNGRKRKESTKAKYDRIEQK